MTWTGVEIISDFLEVFRRVSEMSKEFGLLSDQQQWSGRLDPVRPHLLGDLLDEVVELVDAYRVFTRQLWSDKLCERGRSEEKKEENEQLSHCLF